ncbi:hypothetical protein MYAM1_000209 [Malassezia yamatoensis]|uniref:Uncharacterized protein n=1 Tax=Malassezia yamatoensis TaxID=253288 RepID=A0AAJ6CFT8_9BASI|nr:hypothetical protein MYAM1_000209 [Malassezia yamatoensis]
MTQRSDNLSQPLHSDNSTTNSRSDSGVETRDNRGKSYSSPPPPNPIGYASMPSDPIGWNAGVPDYVQWSMNGANDNTSLLADAYGATHGQPHYSLGGAPWYEGTGAAQYPAMVGMPANLPYSAAQIAQQMDAMHLQSQQSEQIIHQQNQLLAQIQAAQQARARTEREQHNGGPPSLGHHHESPPSRSATSHPNLPDSPVDRRRAVSPLSSSNVSSKTRRASGAPLLAEVSQAMNTMNALRNSHHDLSQDSSITSPEHPSRPNSYAGRERNRVSGFVGQSSSRKDARRTSNLHQPDSDSPERHRSTTPTPPSIVIDPTSMESPNGSMSKSPLRVDINSVGMRMGQRIIPGRSHDTYPESSPNSNESQPDKRHSYTDLGINRSSHRNSRPISPRPASVSGPVQTPLIQPRRQPRGPPTDSFFANNFLARRSLRTRREAMSKLCASPRASSFSAPKNGAAQPSPSPLARKV